MYIPLLASPPPLLLIFSPNQTTTTLLRPRPRVQGIISRVPDNHYEIENKKQKAKEKEKRIASNPPPTLRPSYSVPRFDIQGAQHETRNSPAQLHTRKNKMAPSERLETRHVGSKTRHNVALLFTQLKSSGVRKGKTQDYEKRKKRKLKKGKKKFINRRDSGQLSLIPHSLSWLAPPASHSSCNFSYMGVSHYSSR